MIFRIRFFIVNRIRANEFTNELLPLTPMSGFAPISIKDLSEKLYLSNEYLSGFFKKNYGMSFTEYLTNIRLYHSEDEILYSDQPITRIAYDNRFTSRAVFNKRFKKAYGETPSEMRKKTNGQKRCRKNKRILKQQNAWNNICSEMDIS